MVGFFDFIPLVGATLGAIVVALATLPVGFPTATIVWIAFIIVWQTIPTAAAIQIILREWWSARGLKAPSTGGDEGPAR